jgi:signal recognition particle subunit SRP19
MATGKEEEGVSSLDTKKWKIVYPAYINSKKTVSEGRQIPLSSAVENPTVNEIYEVCKYLGFKCEKEVHLILNGVDCYWENKAEKVYPRDFEARGRVKIEFYSKDKSIMVPEFKNSKYRLI